MNRWLALLLAALAGVALYLVLHRAPQHPTPTTIPAQATPGSAPTTRRPAPGTGPANPTQALSATALPPGHPILPARTLTAAVVPELPPALASLPPETVLENLRTTFHNYAARFGGNPVGTNPEITRALAGENPGHVNFLSEDGNRVNSNGELVDPWGTPYFFHQLSAREMEIHSAGPDRILWTADDLVIK